MFFMVLDLRLIKIGSLGRFPFFMPGSGNAYTGAEYPLYSFYLCWFFYCIQNPTLSSEFLPILKILNDDLHGEAPIQRQAGGAHLDDDVSARGGQKAQRRARGDP